MHDGRRGALQIISKLEMCCCGVNGQVGGMGEVEMGMGKEVGVEMEIRGDKGASHSWVSHPP